jgi:hypothetical protein
MSLNLSNAVKTTRVMNAVSAGTSDTQSSSIIDMQGFDGVVFLASVGTVSNSAVGTLTVQGNTANQTSGMATVSGVTGTNSFTDAGAGASSNTDLLLDYYRPQKRYLRAQFQRATANIVINGIWAQQYRARTEQVTQPATVLVSNLYDA